MSKTSRGFIFASMIYLVLGTTLGVLFFIDRDTRVLRTVHAHLNLVGAVLFMIFGVAYHILPRFRGKPLHSESLAWTQFWLANIGFLGMLSLMTIGAYGGLNGLSALLALFGAILTLSVYLFVYNLWRTLI